MYNLIQYNILIEYRILYNIFLRIRGVESFTAYAHGPTRLQAGCELGECSEPTRLQAVQRAYYALMLSV